MASLERPRVEYLTPEDLVREVGRGDVRIPHFQRSFRWEAADIVRLFDSILRGFPVGNLLLWRRPAPAQRLQVGPLTIDAPATEAALWVVDGQQRIVSLVGALTESHRSTDARFRVHLDLDTAEFHTAGARQQPPVSWLPVSLLMDTARLLRWMRENSDWLTEQQLATADQAAKAVREYQIPTYVVSSSHEAPLLEIFTRMNTTGKRLTKAEVFQALHADSAEGAPTSLHDLGRAPAELGFGALDERLALRCVLAYRGGDVFREDFGDEFASPDDRAETFREVAEALRELVHFLRGEAGIPHVRLLPYSHVLPILVRFVRRHGAPEGRTATLLRRWVWRGAVAGTRARGVSVPEIRNQLAAADTADPVDAAGQLLARVQSFPDFAPELDKVHFSHAMAKLNTLGLLSAEPLDPATGAPVDVARLLDHGSPLHSILGAANVPDAATIANRVILKSGTGRSLTQLLASAAPEVASSHLVDEEAQELLRRLDATAFLARRAEACAQEIKLLVDRMAEWGARDGRSVADMLRSAA